MPSCEVVEYKLFNEGAHGRWRRHITRENANEMAALTVGHRSQQETSYERRFQA